MENMKRVRILTFHWTYNYGGILQAYALQRTIEEKGCNVEFVNYHNEDEILASLSKKRRIIHKIWNAIACMVGRKKRLQRTRSFRESFLHISGVRYQNEEELKNCVDEADYFIVGSDQVWNTDITGNPNVYLLSFLPDTKRRIAYAASFGKGGYDPKYERLYRNELSKFSALSVREENAVDIVDALIHERPPVVLDPVLLLDKEEWETVASKKTVKQKYILCYYMPTFDNEVTEGIRVLSQLIARKLQCKIINVGKKEYEALKIWENNKTSAGPREFLSLIRDASFVITNSFHGTAFSLKMNIPFIVPINMKQPTDRRLSVRIESLLRQFCLENRIVNTPVSMTEEDIEGMLDMNYDEINKRLCQFREISMDYISNALELRK